MNDGYLGSGKLLKKAIQKHGIRNFTKEILHIFQTEEEMNLKEKELVVISEETYNLCEGGKGGFGYINRNGLGISSEKSKIMYEAFKNKSDYKERKILASRKGGNRTFELKVGLFANNNMRFTGKTHTISAKEKISTFQKEKIKCNYCGVIINRLNINRWHNEHCKFKR